MQPILLLPSSPTTMLYSSTDSVGFWLVGILASMLIYFEICTTVDYTLHYIHRLILGPRGPAQEDILGPIGVSEIILQLSKHFFKPLLKNIRVSLQESTKI
jgi:hypothetical protein